jgi:hypothetical protein
MSRVGWIVTLACLALLGLGAWWWNATFELVEKQVDAPLSGEARYNPFYALRKVLHARGIAADARANLDLDKLALDAGDTLVLGGDVRTLSRSQVEELTSWIGDGGHLVFAMPEGDEGRAGELLDALSIKPAKQTRCFYWKTDAEAQSICPRHGFRLGSGEDKESFDLLLAAKAEDGYMFGRADLGDGSWLAAATLDFLHNRELKDERNAEFAWQLLGPMLDKDAKVHLIYATDVPPLYVILVRHGWPALVPLALALLLWLWARSQRFGPILPAPAADRRGLFEHIRAAGEFEYRRRSAFGLLLPLRRLFAERLRRDDPQIAALEIDQQIGALAKARGLPEAQVRQALAPAQLDKPDVFTATIQTLQTLRNSS